MVSFNKLIIQNALITYMVASSTTLEEFINIILGQLVVILNKIREHIVQEEKRMKYVSI